MRIPVQLFTVALSGLQDGAGAPALSQNVKTTSGSSRKQPACSVCRADALVGKSVRGFLLRAAILDEINEIGVRSLLHGGGRERRSSHLLAGGGALTVCAVAAGAFRLVDVFLRPRQVRKNQKQRKSNKRTAKMTFFMISP